MSAGAAEARWELVIDDGMLETHRLRVEGGWLYRETAYAPRYRDRDGEEWLERIGVALVFVPIIDGRAAP